MALAEMVTVRMSRGHSDTTWGFDITDSLTIRNIIDGSLADRAGLLNGDKVVELEGHEKLDAALARQLLSKTEHKVELVVHRTGSSVHRVWKPSITENTEFNRFQHSVHNASSRNPPITDDPSLIPPPPLAPTLQSSPTVPLKVSLEHNNQEDIHIPGFNTRAQPYGSRQEVKHLQYNSPMPLYSPQNAAEQYLQQTGGLFGTDPNIAKIKETPSYLRSETLRLIQESEKGNSIRTVTQEAPHKNEFYPSQKISSTMPKCFICGRNIIGIMCKAFEHTMHTDCFQCATCGSPLKNQGHYFINDKFYCEIHGRQLKGFNQSFHSNLQPENSAHRGAHATSPNHGQSLKNEQYSLSPTARQNYDSGRYSKTATFQQSHRNEFHNDDAARGMGTLQAQGNRVPHCEECRQQIRGAYVLATGLTWCPEHFTCANEACNRKLLDIGFVEDKGRKYCEQCFENLIAPHCGKCNRPITADCLNALQKQWHPHCFVCTHCRKPFGNSAFYLEQGLPYCETDWNALFTTKCVACKFPIEAGDRWVEALGSAFHSNCFNCASCNVNLEGESFYARNGAPYCKLHA